MPIKNYIVKTILITTIFTAIVQQASFQDMSELERVRQEEMLLRQRGRFEIGKQGVPASTKANWNFELQNKWEGGFIEVLLYYYDQNTKGISSVFKTPLKPSEKVRTVISTARQMIIDIYHKGKLFKRITPKPCRTLLSCYETIYLTLGIDGSVYPQTGILKGLANTTDSGLDNSRNIPQSALVYITY